MNTLQSGLLRKYGRVAMQIARDMLALRPGDRIPRIQDYARRCETGNGTVQNALKSLQEAGAVRLEARGHQGTFLLEANYRLLREIAGLSSLLGLMPLPYTSRYEGLASGLYEVFRRHDVDFRLGYMRGARNRLQTLQRGQCDFVVLSGLAAELAVREGGLTEVMRLGPETYVSGHGILLADPARHQGIEDGMRVGVDPHTLDQQWLTVQECQGKQVELVEISYSHLLDLLRQRQIDAAIWNLDEIPRDTGGIGIVPLQDAVTSALARRNTEAVIVIDAQRPDLERLLPEVVDTATLMQVQQEVLTGRRIPSY
jgi:hypothetical protein